jgi:predicted metal-dependent enzyme (double-stranded beta helix superfamily)
MSVTALAGSGNIARLRRFVAGIAQLVESTVDEPEILARGGALLADLVTHDDWLPDEYAVPDPARYRQYLLHCDSRERFSIVSFVWGPGQSTPIHDHRVWGLVGVLRGAELNQGFRPAGQPAGDRIAAAGAGPGGGASLAPAGELQRLEVGAVSAVSPRVGDLHRVANAHDDRVSISIHVYGGNIGAVARATYDVAGRARLFISGYSNRALPNLWDRAEGA